MINHFRRLGNIEMGRNLAGIGTMCCNPVNGILGNEDTVIANEPGTLGRMTKFAELTE